MIIYKKQPERSFGYFFTHTKLNGLRHGFAHPAVCRITFPHHPYIARQQADHKVRFVMGSDAEIDGVSKRFIYIVLIKFLHADGCGTILFQAMAITEVPEIKITYKIGVVKRQLLVHGRIKKRRIAVDQIDIISPDAHVAASQCCSARGHWNIQKLKCFAPPYLGKRSVNGENKYEVQSLFQR